MFFSQLCQIWCSLLTHSVSLFGLPSWVASSRPRGTLGWTNDSQVESPQKNAMANINKVNSYCWWLKSQTTTWDAWNPKKNGINYQPQLVIAGFQPSTVWKPPKKCPSFQIMSEAGSNSWQQPSPKFMAMFLVELGLGKHLLASWHLEKNELLQLKLKLTRHFDVGRLFFTFFSWCFQLDGDTVSCHEVQWHLRTPSSALINMRVYIYRFYRVSVLHPPNLNSQIGGPQGTVCVGKNQRRQGCWRLTRGDPPDSKS